MNICREHKMLSTTPKHNRPPWLPRAAAVAAPPPPSPPRLRRPAADRCCRRCCSRLPPLFVAVRRLVRRVSLVRLLALVR
ncbi:hypothetical protein HanRHA438_Chr12g0563921 [Helianthus annuus]|nr:hypothetical protein HanRHA438_Chr12g0563921 [Helianthus annuus]